MIRLLAGLITAALAVLFATPAFTSQSQEAGRVALVIGNSDYTHIAKLRNPENDAHLMAATLRQVGFHVIDAVNVDRSDMVQAIQEFGQKLKDAGSDAVGLFYFAGHGVQALNSNFLLPLGATIENEADLDLVAINAAWIMRQMENAGNGLNIIVLDACRNNPFQGKYRSVSRGLSRVDAPSGSLIAYSAAPGQVAADGNGDNSPYTLALTSYISQPGNELIKVFRQTRIAVEVQTGGQQTPWEEQSLKADFYFLPGSTAIIVNPAADPDAVVWKAIQDTRSEAVLKAYIEEFPDSAFVAFAKARLGEIQSGTLALPEAESIEKQRIESHDRPDDSTNSKTSRCFMLYGELVCEE